MSEGRESKTGLHLDRVIRSMRYPPAPQKVNVVRSISILEEIRKTSMEKRKDECERVKENKEAGRKVKREGRVTKEKVFTYVSE